jgi:hypothetical protein
MTPELIAEAVRASYACAAACDECANACLREGDVARMVNCVRLCLQSADLCRTTAAQLARHGSVARELAVLCAKACEACGAECDRHEDEHCERCAVECHRCAMECRRVAPVNA